MGINKTLELMRELTQVVAVSGNEINISRILQKYYREYTDEIIYDNLGSVYGVKRSKKKNQLKVMLASHMDEVGFIVKDFTNNGLIKVLSLGNYSKQGLLGQRVRVITNNGEEYKGAIVSKSNSDNVLDDNSILIDIGTASIDELLSLGINHGDSIVVDGSFEVLATGKRIMSKAWNSRYGCVLGVEILEALKDVDLDFDLYVGCTVQHEVGLRGSQTSTNLISPDLAIVLDCLKADDIEEKYDSVGKLGDGVLINFYDKSMMPNRALLNYFKTICRNNDIKYQFYYSMLDGDGGWIHKLLRGCPTLNASICARNVENNSSIIDMNDYLSAKDAVIRFVKSLNIEIIDMFKTENR